MLPGKKSNSSTRLPSESSTPDGPVTRSRAQSPSSASSRASSPLDIKQDQTNGLALSAVKRQPIAPQPELQAKSKAVETIADETGILNTAVLSQPRPRVQTKSAGRKISVAFSPCMASGIQQAIKARATPRLGPKQEPADPRETPKQITQVKSEQSVLNTVLYSSPTAGPPLHVEVQPDQDVELALELQQAPAPLQLQKAIAPLSQSQIEAKPQLVESQSRFIQKVTTPKSTIEKGETAQRGRPPPAVNEQEARIRKMTESNEIARRRHLQSLRQSGKNWETATARVFQWATSLDKNLRYSHSSATANSRGSPEASTAHAKSAYDELNSCMSADLSVGVSTRNFRFSSPPIAPILDVAYSRKGAGDVWLPPEQANINAHNSSNREAALSEESMPPSHLNFTQEMERREARSAAAQDKDKYLTIDQPEPKPRQKLQNATRRIVQHMRRLRRDSGGSIRSISPEKVMQSIQQAVQGSKAESTYTSGTAVGVKFSDSSDMDSDDDDTALVFISEPRSPVHSSVPSHHSALFRSSPDNASPELLAWLSTANSLSKASYSCLHDNNIMQLHSYCLQAHWQNFSDSFATNPQLAALYADSKGLRLKDRWLAELQVLTGFNSTELLRNSAALSEPLVKRLMVSRGVSKDAQFYIGSAEAALSSTSRASQLLPRWQNLRLQYLSELRAQIEHVCMSLEKVSQTLQRQIWLALVTSDPSVSLSDATKEKQLLFSEVSEFSIREAAFSDTHLTSTRDTGMKNMEDELKQLTKDFRISLQSDMEICSADLQHAKTTAAVLRTDVNHALESYEASKLELQATRKQASLLFEGAKSVSEAEQRKADEVIHDSVQFLAQQLPHELNEGTRQSTMHALLISDTESPAARTLTQLKAECLHEARKAAASRTQQKYALKSASFQSETEIQIQEARSCFVSEQSTIHAQEHTKQVKADGELLEQAAQLKLEIAAYSERIAVVESRAHELQQVCANVRELDMLKTTLVVRLLSQLL